MKRFFFHLLFIIILMLILSPSISSQSKTVNSLIEKYLKVWNTGDIELLKDVVSQDFELRHPQGYKPEIGIDNLKKYVKSTREIIPDFTLTDITKKPAGDNAVILTWTCKGTFTSKSDTTGTKTTLEVPGFSIIYFKDNLLTGEWIAFSDVLWASQTGYKIVKP